MPIDIGLSLAKAAAVGALVGASITAVVLCVMHRRRSRNKAAPDTHERTVCLYATKDPLNASIIRASRRGQ